MKTLTRSALILVVILILPIPFRAQNLSPDLVDVGAKLDSAFDENMRGWKRERGSPIRPGENVLIEFWTRCDRRVKVSVLTHASDAQANKSIEDFARYYSSKSKLDDIGDLAFTGGYGSSVAFRRGHWSVFVSTEVVDLMLLSIGEAQRTQLQRSEQAATNKMIARFVDETLKCPFRHCGIDRF